MITPDEKQRPSDALIEDIRRRFPTERLIDATLTAKMRGRSGPPHRSQSLAAVTERLNAFLARRIPAGFTISDIHSLAGGSSKEQFAFRLQWTDEHGKKRNDRLALRMRPTESIVETHPLREYQVLAAVRDVIPVPPLYWIDAEGQELGQPALIYGFCEGIAKPPRDGAHTTRAGFGSKYRALLAPQFVQYFAEMGKFDWRNADMSAFDPPPTGSNAGVLSAINWWHRVWEEDCIDRNPLITIGAQWLRENAPPIDYVSIVHQDFRGGNFLFAPDTGRITAVLDWELVMLGDRHMDLAFFLTPLFRETSEDGEELAGGLLTRERLLTEYERLSGLPVDPVRLTYYHVFACWRSAINSSASAARVMYGQKSHQDIRVGWLLGTAPITLKALRESLEDVIR
ncbi:MAG: phosphotransferase family protein [Steroidobacteraceae bacterium]